VVGVTGCSIAPMAPKKIVFNEGQLKKETYTIFKKDDVSGIEINKNKVVAELKRAISPRTIATSRTGKDVIDIVESAEVYHIKLSMTKGLCDSEVVANRRYELVETDTSIKVTLYGPTEINFSEEAFYENINGYMLCMPQGSEEKTIGILSVLPKKLEISRRVFKLEGELNTEYSDRSIYANFKRIFGSYHNKERISDIVKENLFSLEFKGKKYSLSVEVYPYKNGSKVVYTTTIPYKISSDLSELLTMAEVNQLREIIKQVVND